MKKDIRYVPTPPVVVEAILDLAEVGAGDVVFDLGSGDGRLVLAAARRGARGVGVEIDGSLVDRSRQQAESEGLSDRVEYRQQSFFDCDISDATVVITYLFHSINVALRPKLLAELRPGTRLVSHSFDMADWRAERRVTVDAKWLFLWTIPERGAALRQAEEGQSTDQDFDW